MRARTVTQQVPFTLSSRSDADCGGLAWVHGTIHGTPTVRRAVTDANRLVVVTGGVAEVSWTHRGREVRRLVRRGSVTYMACGHELENLCVRGEQTSMGLELNAAKIAVWTGDDALDGALLTQHLPPHVMDTDGHLLALFSSLLAEHASGSPSGPLYAESLSISIASHLWERHSLRHRTRAVNGLTPSKLSTLRDYMHSAPNASVTLSELSAVVGMTPRHLSRCFKDVMGTSPYRYLLEVRIETAKRQIRADGMSLTAIASALGFASSSHFSTTFRQFVGLSPTAYRLAVRRSAAR